MNSASIIFSLLGQMSYYIMLMVIPLLMRSYAVIACCILMINDIVFHYYPDIHSTMTDVTLGVITCWRTYQIFDISMVMIWIVLLCHSIYTDKRYMIFVPASIVHLLALSAISIVSHPTIFLCMLTLYILLAYSDDINKDLLFCILFGIINYVMPLSSYGIPTNVLQRTMLVSSVFIFARKIELRRLSYLFLCILLSLALMLKIQMPLVMKIFTGAVAGVSIYGILFRIAQVPMLSGYLNNNTAMRKLLVLCGLTGVINMASHNHMIFYRHGQQVLNWGSNRIPIMFVILYVSITVFSFIFKRFKQHRNSLFYGLTLSLAISNLFFLNQTSHIGFIMSLILLGLYTSGVAVVFPSLVSDCVPNESLRAVTFSVYYLSSSVFKILNAIVVSYFQDLSGQIEIMQYSLKPMGVLGISLCFSLGTVMILWGILSYGKFWNKSTLSTKKDISQ